MEGPQELTGDNRAQSTGEGATTEIEGLPGGYSLIELPDGAAVGRYTIVRRVGAGAMGVVYEAHDPSLDRHVAIKILRKRPVDPNESAVGEARLLREARALAQLSHPNVVPVYDVGTTEAGPHTFIFIAMEFVRGATLRSWIKSGQKPIKVLAALKDAGRGLAAAHTAGLVHRDFKLDNVIVDQSGRVRVMDFGLARPQSELDVHLDSGTEVDSLSNLGATLTQAGTVMGTPVYMSPEQHVGKPLDARSDQFSFCAAAYEALFGKRPFVGATTRQLARAKLRGRIRKPATSHRMFELFAVLERGLQPDPADRWPSIAAVTRRLKVRRKRSLVGAFVAGGVVAGVGVGAAAYLKDPSPCRDALEHIEEVWNPEARTQLGDALSAQGSDDIAALTLARIDTYAKTWAQAWQQTCRAGVETTGASDAAIDRQALCLDHGKADLATAIDVLNSLDGGEATRGPFMIAALAPPQSCTSSTELAGPAREAPPRGSAAAESHRLQRRALVRARAGQYAVGLGEAYAALALAAASGEDALIAKAELRVGSTLSDLGHFAAAESVLTSAIWRAESADDDATAASAAAHLVFVVGVRGQRYTEAMKWARLGRAFVDRLPENTDRLAHLLENEANAMEDFGQREEALAQMRRVLELRRTQPASERNKLAMTMNNLGTMLMAMGRYNEARDTFDDALALRKEILGPAHPDTGMTYVNLGALEAHVENYEKSLDLTERGLRIYLAAVGEEHPAVASALQVIAADKMHLGDYSSAIDDMKSLIDIRGRVLGENHSSVADAWSNLGAIYANLGQLDDAEQALARALAVYTMASTEEAELAGVYHNLATVATRQEQLAKGEELYKRSLELWEAGWGATHPDLSYPLSGLGDVMLQRGQPIAARPYLERARTLAAELRRTPRLAQIDFWLAQALWPDPAQRRRAWELANDALPVLEHAPTDYAADHAKLVRWLDEHRANLPPVPGD